MQNMYFSANLGVQIRKGDHFEITIIGKIYGTDQCYNTNVSSPVKKENASL